MSDQQVQYDVGIVGYGPAGITAALYASRMKLSVLLLGEMPGGEVRNSGEIENWPGDGQTDGIVLADKLIAHVKKHADQVKIIEAKVDLIKQFQTGFYLQTAQQTYQTKTVILATGRHPKKLMVPGEEKYRNRGVTYCATCDAPMFEGKRVAVIGGGNTGAEAIIMLQKIASKIYLLHLGEKLAADPVLIQNFINDQKVTVVFDAKTSSIRGEAMVTNLTYVDTKTRQAKELAVEGIFVAIGSIPNSEPVKDLVKLDKSGGVIADRYGRTDVPGFFAAGDVTNSRDAQIVVAAGHGCSAALSARDWLVRQK